MKWALWILLLGTLPTFAEIETPQTGGGAQLSAESTAAMPSFEWVTNLSVFNPTTFFLRQPGYRVGLEDKFTGMPLIHVGASNRLWQNRDWSFSTETTLGFGTRSQRLTVQPDGTSDVSFEDIRVSWFPLHGLGRLTYTIPGFSFFRPSLGAGGGMGVFLQRAALSELNQTHWMPFLIVNPAVTLFERKGPSDVFGGVLFGVSFYTSFASSSKVQGAAYELSFRWTL